MNMSGEKKCLCLSISSFMSVVLFFLLLGVWIWHVKDQAYASGYLEVRIARMMSMTDNDTRMPDLRLEVIAGKNSWLSQIYESCLETAVDETCAFSNVGWNDAIIFRILDVSKKQIRGTLALTPSGLTSTFREIYEMSPEKNWLVMEVIWSSTT